MSGTFFAVVGPSGAGKDTVLDYAREALADNHRFSFPQRWITRPADAQGEQHMPVSRERFARMKREGAFLLDWEAHGLCYGVPAEVGDAVASGTHVVVNLSRAVIPSIA